MTSDIFNKFLICWNKELVAQKRKICLVIDNFASHKILTMNSNIDFFIPPNQTSGLQPLDAGMIKCFKAFLNSFKIHLTHLEVKNDLSVREGFKKLNMNDPTFFVYYTGKKVSEKTISNCLGLLYFRAHIFKKKYQNFQNEHKLQNF